MEALQQLAINFTLDQDNAQQVLLSEADVNAGMDFLRAAGLAPTTLVAQGADSRAATANSGVADALKAMGTDIANKMEEFGQRLALLESQSAGPSADHYHSFDTSTRGHQRCEKTATQHPHSPFHGLNDRWTKSSTTTYSYRGMTRSPGMSIRLHPIYLVCRRTLANCFRIVSRRQSPTLLANNYPPTRVPKLDKMVRDRMSQGAVKLD